MAKAADENKIKLNKLVTSDVIQNKIIHISDANLGEMHLEDSWHELFIAALALLYYKDNEKFSSTLYETGVADSDCEITPQKYIKYKESIRINPIRIPGSNHYLYYDFLPETLAYKLRNILSTLGADVKRATLELAPVKNSDIQLREVERVVKVIDRTLENCDQYMTTGTEIAGLTINAEVYRCRRYSELIASILSYASTRHEYWYQNALKHMSNNFKIGKTREEAVVSGVDSIEIPKTNAFLSLNASPYSAMVYARNLCKEFAINTSNVKLKLGILDFS